MSVSVLGEIRVWPPAVRWLALALASSWLASHAALEPRCPCAGLQHERRAERVDQRHGRRSTAPPNPSGVSESKSPAPWRDRFDWQVFDRQHSSSGTAVLTAETGGYVFAGSAMAWRCSAVASRSTSFRTCRRSTCSSTGCSCGTLREPEPGIADSPMDSGAEFLLQDAGGDVGVRVPDSTIARIADDFRKSVPELTGGKFGCVESGDEARRDRRLGERDLL